ncbi:FG-GAP repeat protein, partial [Membranicola marinus]
MNRLYTVLILFLINTASGAQNWLQMGQDLEGTAANDFLGQSVSLSSDGNIAAIGAPYNGSGYVRIFMWAGGSWIQRGGDLIGKANGDRFGYAVALSEDGNTVAIGAPFNDDNLVNSGQVQVYDWNGNAWIQRGGDFNGAAAYDEYGYSISLSSDGHTVAISGPNNDISNNNAGHVRVHDWHAGSQAWIQRGADIHGEAPEDHSGLSIAMSSDGNIVAIGAILNDDGGDKAGHVRVYVWNGTIWVQRGNDIDGRATFEGSGRSVSLSSDGNTVTTSGAANTGLLGHVRTFDWIGGSWIQRGNDLIGVDVNGTFGWSSSLSADGMTVAVGARSKTSTGDRYGQVRIYEWLNGQWVQSGNDMDGKSTFEWFGHAVALASDGHTVAVGAPRRSIENEHSVGAVQIFSDRPQIVCPGDTTVDCGAATDTAFLGSLSNLLLGPGESLIVENDSMGFDGTCNNYTVGYIDRHFMVQNDNTSQRDTVCMQRITVVDTIPPTLVCAADTILDCTTTDIDTALLGVPMVSDECDANPVLSYRDDSTGFDGTCSGDGVIGQITRRFFATDLCGNVDSCDQVITFVDTTAPALACAPDTILDCTVTDIDTALLGVPLVSDDCDANPVLTYRDDSTGFDGMCSGDGVIGQITRRFYATDLCGNVDSCDQVLTFVDTTAPTLVCVPDTTLDCTVTDIDTAILGVPLVSDDCDANPVLTYRDDSTGFDGSCSGDGVIGQITRRFYATDLCGNVDSCDQVLTFVDTTAPTLVCVADTTLDCAVTAIDTALLGVPMVSDDCDVNPVLTYRDDSTGFDGSCSGDGVIGQITRRFFATDLCGNVDSCDQVITFVDTTAPVVIYSPGDTTVDCSVAVPPLDSTVVVAMDPCSESLTYLPASSIEPGNCSNSFTIFQSLQILDQCGNDTTVSRTVTVIDTIPPTPVSCPTQSIINCLVGDPLPINIPSYTDNCSPTDSIVVTMRIDSVGFNTIATDDDTVFIHYFAEDECGNVDSTCTQIVVCEYVCPTINCHGMVNVGFGPNCMIEITPEMVLTQPLDSFAARFTTVTLTNQFGGVIPDNLLSYKDRGRTFTATIRSDIPGCGYYECSTQVVVDDQAGSLRFVSAFQSNLPGDAMVYNLNTPSASNYSEMTGPHISQGKMNVYCGQIPDPSEHTPLVMDQCTGQQYTPKVQPDWVMMPNACGEGDTAKVIWRTWESFDKNGQLTTLTDTIVVFRLPQLSQEDFLAAAETEFFCKVEAGVEPGDALKRYAAWKQPVGIHDYEYPHSKLRGVIYDLPLTVIEAGLDHAWDQGPKIFAEYLECVILQKADGTQVTIKDIITGDYGDDVVANATQEQLGYGLLHDILEGGISPTSWTYGSTNYTFVPYLLLQEGDLILSEGGTFVQVDSDWFYNGHGNSPFWFSGGWPSIYGSGDCVSYCDVGAGEAFDCVRVVVPGLTIEEGISTTGELCEEICLKEGVHCGIQIRQESADWSGSCPQTRGLDTYVTQTCWATTENVCAIQSEIPSEAVVDYEPTDKSIKIHISEWQTLVDTMGPIFDFCYPAGWDQEAIQESIHDGAQYGGAAEWEFDNPTTYRVGTHECAAEVYVPSVQVVDNCSGVHAVKAMVEVQGGTRAVALELTNTETKTLASGEVCTVYTYSHTADPITIPFSGCDGELTEVVYEAADNCWNQSTWSKFIRVTDDVPPTVVVDRNLNVTLADKIAWVPAVNWDEGSWDNCAIDLRLGRR